MINFIVKLPIYLVCLWVMGCSTTPNLDKSFGGAIREALKNQTVDPKNDFEEASSVTYPFTTNLMK